MEPHKITNGVLKFNNNRYNKLRIVMMVAVSASTKLASFQQWYADI